jgi:CBS domain-containing protein
MPEAQELFYAAPDDPVGRVLEEMALHGFSQVPIRARAGAEVRGVFSHRSFAQRVTSSLKLRGEIVEWPVEALAEDPRPFVDPTEELVEIFDVLDAKEFALVGTPRNLFGIVTATDVLRWLHDLAQPFVLFGEIEKSLRQLVAHRLDHDGIAAAARTALSKDYIGREERLPLVLEDMSLGELYSLVIHGENWRQLDPVLGTSREWAISHLNGLSTLRNHVFHFRRDLDSDELDQVLAARRWLLTRVDALEPDAAL